MAMIGKLKMPAGGEMHGGDSNAAGGKYGMEEGSDAEESAESPEEEASEDSGKSDGELAKISDDELMAEVKKRGLVQELESEDQGSDQADQGEAEASDKY